MRMRHTFISGLAGSAIFFRIICLKERFSKKKFTEHKICFDFIHNFCLKYLSIQDEMYEILS